MLRRLVYLSASVFFLIAPAGRAADLASVSGEVLDSSGARVPSAAVALHQVAGSVLIRTQSDDNGVFLFTAVPAGSYLLDAGARSLMTEQPLALAVSAGETKTVRLTLVVSSNRAEVTVTAAGIPQTVDENAKALDVVPVADAQQRGLFLASDALRFTPGLTVSSHGGPGSYTEIQTRGLPVQDTALLFNGSPLRDPTSPQDEASALWSQLLLVNTARIEVLRGSGSSVYGTNAVSGAINLLSAGGGGGLHGDADMQGGGLGLFEGSARVSGGLGQNRLTYNAGAAHLNQTRGVDDVGAARNWAGQAGAQYELTPTVHAAVDLLGSTNFAQVSETPTSLATGIGIIPAVAVPGSQLKLANQGLAYDPGSATFLPSVGDPDSDLYSHFLNTLLRFDQQITPTLNYRLAYAVTSTARNNTDGPGGLATANYFAPEFNTSDRYNGHVDNLDATVHWSPGMHQVVSAGYEFVREHYLNVSTDANPDPAARIFERTAAEQRWQSAFVQDEMRLFDSRLQILLSGRFTGVGLDQPTFLGGDSPYAGTKLPQPPSAYTGDASIAYFFPQTRTKIRGHVGNSFRMPSLYERFGGYFFGSTFYGLGDPRLSPERAVSVDGGVDQYFAGERVKISATYFYSRLQQVIGFTLFPPNVVDPYGRADGYFNTGGGIARGVEVSGQARLFRHTLLNASYTYTSTLDRTSEFYTGTARDPLQFPRILPHEFKLVATQQIGRRVDLAMDFDAGSSYLFPLFGADFTASTAFRFDGPRQLGLSAGYTQPLTEHSSLRFYTRVSNALDQAYYQDGFRTPGRWATAGLHWAF